MKNKLLISLYDYSGVWAQPFIDAGWKVLLWDEKVEGCILEHGVDYIRDIVEVEGDGKLDGLLAAPPCTAFASSGARWWKSKHDQPLPSDHEYFGVFESFTEYMVTLTLIVLVIKEWYNPGFWALENPVGRIEKLVPELKQFQKYIFNPCDFGHPYTKKTIIYGEFNDKLKRTPVEPTEGSRMHKIWPGPKRQELRSETPEGFAKAFFEANRNYVVNRQLKLAI